MRMQLVFNGFVLGMLAWCAQAEPPGEAVTIDGMRVLPVVQHGGEGPVQVLRIRLVNPGAPLAIHILLDGKDALQTGLAHGESTVEASFPAVTAPSSLEVNVALPDRNLDAAVDVAPVRPWQVFLLPHSHVDIGYTHVQSEVEAAQGRFLDTAMEAAERTAQYPEGAQFRWNSEVLWAVDSYLKSAAPEKRAAFEDAVRQGTIDLNGLYGNELTALCRPEELVRLTSLACSLRRERGLPVASAMISDVPGYTWGLAEVLAQSGIRYFSVGPNRGDRIGYLLDDWGDRPFWWESPSGEHRVLVWVAAQGYSWFHSGPLRDGARVLEYLEQLEDKDYPYDMVQLRYNTGGDNGPPDTGLCEFVRDWNAATIWPQLKIATATEMFRTFEEKYGAALPVQRGDITPYWEDGAASTAVETGINRVSAERLTQSEILWSLLDSAPYPQDEFRAAWRNVVLYSEHTWGAHNSISEPDSTFVKAQWAVKQAFALDGERQAARLLNDALAPLRCDTAPADTLLVFNVSNWPRTGLISLPAETKCPGDAVSDDAGNPVPSQRLTDGSLVFLATQVPAFGAARYHVAVGNTTPHGDAHAEGTQLTTGALRVELDPGTGDIAVLESSQIAAGSNLVDESAGGGLNSYRHVDGKDPARARGNGHVKVRTGESGPLVASLIATSHAPGCNLLEREVRVISGLPHVEIINRLDKRDRREKEGLHFGFPFAVTGGVMRMDLAWSVIRPEHDQLNGSCKNWITVQRWVDVSNKDHGVAWATLDAPLVEVGAINAEARWMRHLADSQSFYSYIMNNYWHTNYKASQGGSAVFRYALLPHGPANETALQRFGMERSQPLIVVPVKPGCAAPMPRLAVESAGAVVTTLKRAEGGTGWILRVFGASGQPDSVRISSPAARALEIRASDLTEREGEVLEGAIPLPAYAMRTVLIQGL